MLKGSDGLMSLALSSDGKGRSGSGETQARPKATVLMTEKYALVLYLNEKSCIGRKVKLWVLQVSLLIFTDKSFKL